MRTRVVRVAAMLLMALSLARPSAPAAGAGNASGGLVATRVLAARLSRAGRGEAALTLTRSDPMGGPSQTERGRVALEPPARVRLDFPGSGERIAVRAAGGEWIQPSASQMVRLKPEQTATAAGLWKAFLRGGSGSFKERRVSARKFVLEARASEPGLPDRITVEIDARGLPSSLEMDDGAGSVSRYRFGAWRFSRARGDSGFTLRVPAGFVIVDMP